MKVIKGFPEHIKKRLSWVEIAFVLCLVGAVVWVVIK